MIFAKELIIYKNCKYLTIQLEDVLRCLFNTTHEFEIITSYLGLCTNRFSLKRRISFYDCLKRCTAQNTIYNKFKAIKILNGTVD